MFSYEQHLVLTKQQTSAEEALRFEILIMEMAISFSTRAVSGRPIKTN